MTLPNRSIALVPVDARPVVREQVVAVVATAGVTLMVPPADMLGHFRKPGDRDAIAGWLIDHSEKVDGFVLSLDMLVYGGLVPSRFIEDTLPCLTARLDVVRQLKSRHPHKPVYAFLATMRISNNNVNAEEKLYWDQFGELIWRWSYYTDKHLMHGDKSSASDSASASKTIAAEAERQIPASIRQDYLSTRARNFSVAESAIALVEYAGINGLILPQDDTAAYGFNIAERRRLEKMVSARQMQDRVRIYSGADEVAHTLCAHLINEAYVNAPLKVHLLFSDPQGVTKLTARYEDRPLMASLKSQLDVVDATEVDTIEAADVVIAVHTQGEIQGDWAMCIPPPFMLDQPSQPRLAAQPGIDPAWWLSFEEARRLGKPIAVADLAYANGGDPLMLEQLATRLPLTALAAYAGWNTASNSIGSVVSQCSLARGATSSIANQQVLCLRLVEDYLYQAIWRQNIRDAIDESMLGPAELEAAVADMFIPAANHWLAAHRFMFRVASIRLPWQRTFEIDIQLIPVADRQEK